MTEPAIVLLNPAANGGRALALRRPIERWLAHHAPKVPLLAPSSADAALATLMVLAPRTRVVVVGGDGSVQVLLPAFLRNGHRLGLVPAGRDNTLAQALGVADASWRSALGYALAAPVGPIDIGQVQTERETAHFAARLSAGFEAQVAQRLQRLPAWWPLRLAQRLAIAQVGLRMSATEARVWVDGRLEHEGQLLLCSLRNAPGDFSAQPLALEARIDDGLLETLVVGALGRLALPRLLPQLLAQRPAAHRSVQLFEGHKVLIDTRLPMALCADGEPLPAASRFTVQTLPRAVYAAGRHAGAVLTSRMDP